MNLSENLLFENCKSIYLVRRDGSKKESLEKLFSLLVVGTMYKLHPLSQTWTYNASGVHGPTLNIESITDLLFLGIGKMGDNSRVNANVDFARFLHNSQVLWIPLDELIRCNIYEYE